MFLAVAFLALGLVSVGALVCVVYTVVEQVNRTILSMASELRETRLLVVQLLDGERAPALGDERGGSRIPEHLLARAREARQRGGKTFNDT